MITVDKSDIPNNRKELLVVEKSIATLSVYMGMLRRALSSLRDNFAYREDLMQSGTTESYLFLSRYSDMSAQANIAFHLFAECYDYVCLLCGESNAETTCFDKAAECRQILRELTNGNT